MDYVACFRKIRKRYLPYDQDKFSINTLFIGESPPEPTTTKIDCESIRFFYNKNTPLFSHIKEAFSLAYPEKHWENDNDFLDFFMQNGYFLIDLCDEPINKMTKTNRLSNRKNGEIQLKDKIQSYRPKNIVIVMKDIKENVDSAIAQIPSQIYNIDKKNIKELPFPRFQKQRVEQFKKELSEFLKIHIIHENQFLIK